MDDEYSDIVDEDDKFVRKDRRNNIYAKGLNCNIRVVNIFVFNSKGLLLLPKRSIKKKIFPGCFDFSCGEHILAGEDYFSAAVRGLKEELGIIDEKPIELKKLTPKNGVSCFMKVYKIYYDEEINGYSRNEIDKLFWYDLKTVSLLIKKDRNKFKNDFYTIFNFILSSL